MKPAFHQDATIFGYADGELFANPIQLLFDRVDHAAPATGLHALIVVIDIVDTIAGVRLELDDWNGRRLTDLLTLLKLDGAWKICKRCLSSASLRGHTVWLRQARHAAS